MHWGMRMSIFQNKLFFFLNFTKFIIYILGNILISL